MYFLLCIRMTTSYSYLLVFSSFVLKLALVYFSTYPPSSFLISLLSSLISSSLKDSVCIEASLHSSRMALNFYPLVPWVDSTELLFFSNRPSINSWQSYNSCSSSSSFVLTLPSETACFSLASFASSFFAKYFFCVPFG